MDSMPATLRSRSTLPLSTPAVAHPLRSAHLSADCFALGYATPFADELFGSAILDQLKSITEQEPLATRYGTVFQATLEGAANIPNEPLQQLLVDYSINGPEHIRPLASESISDPRLVSLVAVPEQLEPNDSSVRDAVLASQPDLEFLVTGGYVDLEFSYTYGSESTNSRKLQRVVDLRDNHVG